MEKTSSTSLSVRRSPLSRSRGILQAGPLRLHLPPGRTGTSVFKREGDGASPVSVMRLLSAVQRPQRLLGLHIDLPAVRSRSDSGWCDDPTSSCYNRPVRLPFHASSETMHRHDRLYD